MKNGILLFLIIYSSLYASGQYEWRKKACLPSWGRIAPGCFAVGGKGYIVGGTDPSHVASREVWCYDPISNTWLQKQDFPRTATCPSIFVINDTAYAGLGQDSLYTFHTDFYKYNVTNDSWTPIASFPAAARTLTISFGLNDRGYIGGGFNGGIFGDFYAYDPHTNVWTQRANIPGGNRQTGLGVAIGNFGIVGLGYNGSAQSDFYKYDPVSNSWSTIVNLPDSARWTTSFFVLRDTLYMAGGHDNTNFFFDCWRYNAGANVWSRESDYSCLSPLRSTYGGFTLDGHGYTFGGISMAGTYLNDLLEFGSVDTSFYNHTGILGRDTVYTQGASYTLSVPTSCAHWSTGSEDSFIVVNSPGSYWVRYSDGCNMSTDTLIIHSLNVGIENSLDQDIFIYPNPVHNTLIIQSENTGSNGLFVITDLMGSILHSGIITSKFTFVDLDDLANGLYYLSTHSKRYRIQKVN